MKFRRFKVINLIDKKVTEFQIKCITKNPLKEFLNFLFGEHELIDCQHMFHSDVGHPDYLVKKKLNLYIPDLYVEYKSPKDNIHTSQIEWIFKNPNKKTVIIHQLD